MVFLFLFLNFALPKSTALTVLKLQVLGITLVDCSNTAYWTRPQSILN